MDDDDDLWGPPFVVQSDSPRKPIPRGCEFWFDYRTDVIEENYQNAKYCEIVWNILNEKKQDDDQVCGVEKDSVSVQKGLATTSGSGGSGDAHDVTSFDSDKTLSATLPEADTSSAKSVLDEDENTSSISDAQTIEKRDSSNDTGDVDPETKVKPQETAAKDSLIVEVAKEADTSPRPVLVCKIEEADEHSCSSLVSDQVCDSIKQAPENKTSSAISQESIGGETTEKVKEKANATKEDGEELLKEHQQSDSLQDIVTVSEHFTTESLLDMCDGPDKGREVSCDERSKTPHLGAVKTVVTDELIINLLRQKAGSNALLNPRCLLLKKKQNISNSSMNAGFIRNTKQKVGGEAAVKNSTQSIHQIIRAPNVPTKHPDSTMDSIDRKVEQIMIDSVVTVSDLKNKTGKELRSIAKAWKITHYYKLKKEDLLQQLTRHLTDCTKQSMEP